MQRGFLCSPNSPRLDITLRDGRLFETSLRPSLDSLVGFAVIELEYESVEEGTKRREKNVSLAEPRIKLAKRYKQYLKLNF